MLVVSKNYAVTPVNLHSSCCRLMLCQNHGYKMLEFARLLLSLWYCTAMWLKMQKSLLQLLVASLLLCAYTVQCQCKPYYSVMLYSYTGGVFFLCYHTVYCYSASLKCQSLLLTRGIFELLDRLNMLTCNNLRP